MNFRHLHVFVTVVDSGSMSETARMLYMTQPAVSQTIAELEKEFRVKLFERLSKKLVQTEAGELLYYYAKKILQQVDEVEKALEDMANAKRGRLRIGASTTIGTYLLSDIIGDFKRLHQNSEFHFTIDNTGIIEDMIMQYNLDLGLVEGPVHAKELRVETFMEDELYLLCAPTHHWIKAGRKTISLVEVRSEPMILREKGSGTREVVENLMAEHNLLLNPSHILSNTEAIKKAVMSNLGVAFISKLAVREEMNMERLIKIDLEGIRVVRNLNIIYHKDKFHSVLFDDFINHFGLQIKGSA